MLIRQHTVLICFLITFTASISATQLPKAWKIEFAKGFIPRCVEQQRKAPMYKPVMELSMKEYCQCTANRAVDNITLEEAKNRLSYTVNDALRPTIEEAGNYCIKLIMQRIKQTETK